MRSWSRRDSLFLALLPAVSLCVAQQQPVGKMPVVQASMIWCCPEVASQGKYVAFRKSFELQAVEHPALLQLFADSRYLLWINGQYVLRGPCRFNPRRPEYDVIDVGPYLQQGRNAIAVLVHHYGNVINGRIMKHAPGLGAVLTMNGKECVRTDSTWKYSDSTMHMRSPESWNTIPDVIDGRVETGAWLSDGFDDSSWPHSRPVDGTRWGPMQAREIPLPRETPLGGLRVLPSGEPLDHRLPVELAAGQDLRIDLGTMALAYASVDLEADAGTVLTMRYALRYKNGTLVELYGPGCTYTARGGRQTFMTTDQWCGHYILLKCESGRIRIHGLAVKDRRYPFDRLGSFTCNDTVLTNLWDMAVRTIEVTSDDGYGSDARERDEWLQDPAQPNFITTRVALAGPGKSGRKVFSDPRLLKNLLRHAALSQLPDGRILATFPTDRGPEDCHYFIDDYACLWVEALKMYYDATGDELFLREMWPTVTAQMKWFLDRITTRGLLLAREYASFDNPFAYITCEGTTINAFLYGALTASSTLGQALDENAMAGKYSKAAARLKAAFNAHLWNEKESAYNSACVKDTVCAPTVHAQLIALHYGLVPEKHVADVRHWFLTNYKNPGMIHVCNNTDVKKMVAMKAGLNMPVMYYWAFSELYRMDTQRQDEEAISEMRRRWGPMVLHQQDAGTLSESFTDENGEGATESCHNYGSVPAYFLSSYILGVHRIGPVADSMLLIEPRLGDLSYAGGSVVTEFGVVPVSWKRTGPYSLTFKLSIPEGVKAELRLPKYSDEAEVILNGRTLAKSGEASNPAKSEGRWIVVRHLSGEQSGYVEVRTTREKRP